jgi:monoamine oxidase
VSLTDIEVVVVGGGAAGIGAAHTLRDAGLNALIVEARDRLGGRAWTVPSGQGFPIDLGCGWLHSADQNIWREIAEREGYTIDHTPPPWSRPTAPIGSAPAEQAGIGQAIGEFRGEVDEFPESEPDRPASAFLPADGRWNGPLNAISTFYSGAELDRISTRDLARYDDTGVNWRVVEGYGTLISAYGADLPIRLNCTVRTIDHRGKRLAIETSDGTIAADKVIVTLSSNLIAANESLFLPALPEKAAAASNLPLGLADKIFLSLDHADEFNDESRAFGRTDSAATAAYHFRPFGRPEIEAYFGGMLAAELEKGGETAFFDFARTELVRLYGADFAKRIRPLAHHAWGVDPFALGSYSYAKPGHADDRAALAAPVEERIFFAGEATSRTGYSTAHGALQSGIDAANQVIASRPGK